MSRHFIFKLLTNKGGEWDEGNKEYLFNEYGVYFGLMKMFQNYVEVMDAQHCECT